MPIFLSAYHGYLLLVCKKLQTDGDTHTKIELENIGR